MEDQWKPVVNATINHVLSQLIFKNIPLPKIRHTEGNNLDPVHLGWNESQWLEAVEYLYRTENYLWPLCLKNSKRFSSQRLAKNISNHLVLLQEAGGCFITQYHRHYPKLLQNIKDKPSALSVLGASAGLSRPKLSVVGSRQISGSALTMTEALGQYLADNDIVVTSGGAVGCDIAAHYGALRSESRPVKTIVVFANGLKALYPKRNLHVFNRILSAGGALVSERLFWDPCRAFDFPIRNRIITGMSRSTIVVQAALRSGSYLSANLALDQGRDVLVFDHPEEDVRFEGNRKLIEDGAPSFRDLSELRAFLSG